jgi:hypothetical protein
MKKIIMVILLAISVIITLTCDNDGENLFIFPSTPYLGIMQTGDAGPDPLGGDKTDWLPIPEEGIIISAAYPNPTDSMVILRFSNLEPKKGLIYLHHPFTNQLEMVADSKFEAGVYEIEINLKKMKFQNGIIRAYFKFGEGLSWGDIFYR